MWGYNTTGTFINNLLSVIHYTVQPKGFSMLYWTVLYCMQYSKIYPTNILARNYSVQMDQYAVQNRTVLYAVL